MVSDKSDRIRELNDEFRRNPRKGKLVMTAGIAAEGASFQQRAWKAIQQFDAFTPSIDPHGEHDMVTVEIDGETVYWKVDYYSDATLQYGSEDPSDEKQCFRVGTILFASEY